MAAFGGNSMISPPSSNSNGDEPFGQLPPLPPPLRSTEILQPLTVFPVSNLSEDSYDYVFGGRRETPPVTSSIKLTSPPIRIRTDEHTATLIGEPTSSTSHLQHTSYSHCKVVHSSSRFPPRTPPRTTSASAS
uniref:Uncharacterized protein n=1 Tax=Megaselia scalaris TaxID=36166 RepID=T1GE09_MEGSC